MLRPVVEPYDPSFRADSAERLLQPQPGAAASRPIGVVPLLAAGAIYAALLALLLLESWLENGFAPPPAQEIPVEIVVEPPPQEQPEPPKPEPQAMTQPLFEEPAHDAPRAPTEKKSEKEGPDQNAKPPNPSPEPKKEAGQAKEGEVESKDTIETLIDKTVPDAVAQTPEEPEKQAKAEANPVPTFDSVPDVDFDAAAKQTPVSGGKAKATYLSILYGMIMSHLRQPNGPRTRFEGAIVFSVDGRGNLGQRRIAQSSGSRELDRAAYDAIGQASPFPPPPQGAPIGLRFTFGAN